MKTPKWELNYYVLLALLADMDMQNIEAIFSDFFRK